LPDHKMTVEGLTIILYTDNFNNLLSQN